MESRQILVSLSLSAASIVRATTHVCGDANLQMRLILAVGANARQADHAIDRFESLFCNHNVAA